MDKVQEVCTVLKTAGEKLGCTGFSVTFFYRQGDGNGVSPLDGTSVRIERQIGIGDSAQTISQLFSICGRTEESFRKAIEETVKEFQESAARRGINL